MFMRRLDAIVVGSGLGGLTAAALYARAGRKVLVLERNDTFGGAATVYRHGALAIEASLHEIDGLDPNDAKLPLLQSLGLDQGLEFVEVGDLYEVRGPQFEHPFVLPHGVENALASARAQFPAHSEALGEYFRRLSALRDATSFAAHHQDDSGKWWLQHLPEAVRRIWPILREGRATVSEVMDELFGPDETVKLALAANLSYYHSDPDRMPFLMYAVPQASYLLGGGHYVRGGSQALSDRLVALICEAGGIVESGREVDTLKLEGHRVDAVGHHARAGGDAQMDFAPVVFGNAAPQRLAEMLPPVDRETFLARYATRQPSISLWSIAIGLKRPASEFGVNRYSTFLLPAWLKSLRDFREAPTVLAEESSSRMPPYVFVDYGRIDSGLNQAGPYLGSLCGMDSIENWTTLTREANRARRERWMRCILADLDGHFPGIASAVVQREMATAETMAQYLNTPNGAVYGFASDAATIGPKYMTPRTPIEGLWLASAFVSGGGFTGAMMGGAAAARAALRSP
jgi:all-trans-retinol 13,14-reductase